MNRIGNPDGVRAALNRSDLDAVIAVSPENVPYLSNCIIGTQTSIRDRLALVLWPKGGEPTFLVCAVEAHQARDESWIPDIRTYVEFQTSPVALLADVMREKGLLGARVGIELGYLSARYFAELQALAPGVTWVDSEQFFDRARVLKAEHEIDQLREAAVATEKAMLEVYTSIRPGEPERSMKARLISRLLELGADSMLFTYINAGPNTGYPHNLPGDYRCQAGDVIKSDVGGRWGAYVSDIARTGVVGTPSAKQADLWARLREVHVASIDQLRPGKLASDCFLTMKAGMERVGLPFPLPHAGHSVGVSGHEWPMLTAANHVPIEPGMCFMVETRARWPGQEGYHMEDLILVTASGPRWLTDTVFPNQRLLAI